MRPQQADSLCALCDLVSKSWGEELSKSCSLPLRQHVSHTGYSLIAGQFQKEIFQGGL
jgi:hypothetical protein